MKSKRKEKVFALMRLSSRQKHFFLSFDHLLVPQPHVLFSFKEKESYASVGSSFELFIKGLEGPTESSKGRGPASAQHSFLAPIDHRKGTVDWYQRKQSVCAVMQVILVYGPSRTSPAGGTRGSLL